MNHKINHRLVNTSIIEIKGAWVPYVYSAGLLGKKMRCDSHYQGGWQGVSKTRWVMTSTLLRWRLRGAVFTGNWSWWEMPWDPWPHYHPTWAGNSMGLWRMHRGTYMPWGMSGLLIRGGGEKFTALLVHAHSQVYVSGKRRMWSILFWHKSMPASSMIEDCINHRDRTLLNQCNERRRYIRKTYLIS